MASQFEQATRQHPVFTFGPAIPLKAEIEKGATFDIAILTDVGIDELIEQGKLVAASRTLLASGGAGLAIRKGAARPDISSVDKFKQALLAAKSIAYGEQGSTGVYLEALLPKLGLAEALKDRILLLPREIPAAQAVADGKAELGMTQISEILPCEGAELAGPFPQEIQLTTRFVAAIAAAAKQPASCGELLDFLTGPAAASVFRAKGLEPAK